MSQVCRLGPPNVNAHPNGVAKHFSDFPGLCGADQYVSHLWNGRFTRQSQFSQPIGEVDSPHNEDVWQRVSHPFRLLKGRRKCVSNPAAGGDLVTPALPSGPLNANANVGAVAQNLRDFPGVSGANQDVADIGKAGIPRQGQFDLSVGVTLGAEDVGVGQEVLHARSLMELQFKGVRWFLRSGVS